MEHGPAFFDVGVAGGAMRVGRWGTGERLVLGIHGVTASSVSLAPIAHHLGADYTLVAPDLRGRGDSARLPGPFGMQAHAEDCAAIIESAGAGPAIVVGVSMGAFVAVVLAAARPALVERLVLVDGGLPPPMPEGVDPDVLLDAVLGPAIARLHQVFPTRESYLDFWRVQPALSEDWNEDVEAYLQYDLEPTDGGFRSKVSEAAVRADAAENLTDVEVVSSALRELRCPVALLRAPRGLLNQPMPLLPDEVVDQWRGVLPQLVDEVVDDTNHYTIAFGERGSKLVAERVAARP
jgi:pimeloyl-ACP methyl ester carboxylesterase